MNIGLIFEVDALFFEQWCYFSFRCVDFLQVRTPQGTIIRDNCGIDECKLDGVVRPFGKENLINKA